MNRDEVRNFTIDYSTNEGQTATSWLNKKQTADGKLDYMFTQCESIHCRAVAPLQDTPAIKATYNVITITPVAYNTFVSGEKIREEIVGKNKHTYFEMKIPVESYLLAIASGAIEEAQIGERTYVISEPSQL